ncbi:MAG TPA: putative Ig domain-containing protein, partial [Reyranella sp.]|nr:putative Ig domain-containing protein [Reyranella sp.]
YSTDGGSTWTAIATTGLGDTAAIILPSSAMLRFVPAGGFVGEPGALQVRLIDTSGGPVAFSAAADVTINGGTSAISSSLVPLGTTVTALPATGDTSVRPNVISPSDYLSRDLWDSRLRVLGDMASDWLTGSNVYRTMLANQPGTANVSVDVFYGTAPRQNLRFEAASISGGPIPPWLFFDPTMLSFSGTPPAGTEGRYDLRIVATDRLGRTATADVHIIVLREPVDLATLLRAGSIAPLPPATEPRSAPPAAAPDAPAPPAAADPPAPPAPSDDTGTTPPQLAPTAPTGPSGDGAFLLPVDPGAAGAMAGAIQDFGLSPQLREQTQAGRLARARALLDALAA